jgi:hypothetical protein
MSRCRATSFYLAPGVLRYFKDHTVCARTPGTGELVEFTHREHVRRFQDAHPGWDGAMLVGPPGGAAAMAALLEDDPGAVELFRTSPRTIEGRRPQDAASYVAHRWAVGGLESAGGARQVGAVMFPGAGRAVLSGAAALAGAGGMWQTQVLGAAWRSGLLDDPHLTSRLLRGASRAPIRTLPDPMLEPLLSHVAWLSRNGVDVDIEAVLTGLADPMTYLDAGAKLPLAENPSTPPDVLAALSADEGWEVRQGVAKNPSAPPDVLAALSADENYCVRQGVAENPSTPPYVLASLSADEDNSVRGRVARNPSTPPDVLAALSADEGWEVRAGVARNPSTPPDVLAALSADEYYYYVRQDVAKNPSTPPDVLAALSADENYYVRQGVAKNPSTPPDVLAALSADEAGWVRGCVANNPSTPPDVLAALYADENGSVRQDVAESPSTPPYVLASLSADEDDSVRGRVAKNPSTPPDVLAALSADENNSVRGRVANNLSTPPDVFAALSADGDYWVRGCVAKNPSTPPDVLAALSADEVWEVRADVAENPSTPPDVLDALSADEAGWVRQAAARNPNLPFSHIPRTTLEEHRDIAHYRQVLEGHPLSERASHQIAAAALIGPASGKSIRTVRDLDTSQHTRIVRGASAELAAQAAGERDGFTVEPIETLGELQDTATHMGNCVAGYEGRIRAGRSIIFRVSEAATGEEYNVALERRDSSEGGSWSVGEINSRFNAGVDDVVHRRITSLFGPVLDSRR